MSPLRDGPLGADEGISDALRSLQRHEPPAVTLETILDRWQLRRRNAMLSTAMALGACVLAFVLVPSSPPEIPVHLKIRVIEVSPEAGRDEAPTALPVITPLAMAPEELQAP